MPARLSNIKRRATIICLRTGKVLLVRRKGGKWNFPGGGIERGEMPQAAASRELGEEASLSGYVPRALCTIQVRDVVHHVFVINLPEDEDAAPANEIVACKWVHRSKLARSMLKPSAAALLAMGLPALAA
ncbi:TPA: NUDIX domain-containing protein [Pseudomonas putida]|uniref:NUDIX domain-containing protein n=1 Tax=Pseudomonas TaxID=286 RepID=UPI000F4037F8|nr:MULTISPECIES: NUDIX domain-containing protein [Pseudomonas]RNF72812.1 NUDIX domain-containing protein [Pseudomonas putida]